MDIKCRMSGIFPYAVVLVAATAFAAVLIAIVKSDVVKTLLTGLIKKALSVG